MSTEIRQKKLNKVQVQDSQEMIDLIVWLRIESELYSDKAQHAPSERDTFLFHLLSPWNPAAYHPQHTTQKEKTLWEELSDLPKHEQRNFLLKALLVKICNPENIEVYLRFIRF